MISFYQSAKLLSSYIIATGSKYNDTENDIYLYIFMQDIQILEDHLQLSRRTCEGCRALFRALTRHTLLINPNVFVKKFCLSLLLFGSLE
jgi:hypothetical protein